MRRYVVGSLATALMVGPFIAWAPPANAGCANAHHPLDPGATYCDDPVRPDGTWRRCLDFSSGLGDCNVMGPGRLPFDFVGPPGHIDDDSAPN